MIRHRQAGALVQLAPRHRAICRVSALEGQPKMTAYRRADSLAAHSRYNHEFWRGYVGNWYLQPHNPGHPDHKVIHGLRSLKWRDASREVLDQVCVYDAYKAPAKQRDVDSLWQANSFFDHSVPGQDKEEVVVNADDRVLHLLAVDADCAGQVPFALPPIARSMKAADAAAPAAGSSTWGLELYLWDRAGHRWSASIVYSRSTGELERVVLVQEAYTDIKPSTTNVLALARGRIPEPRDCLDSNERAWLLPGSAGTQAGLYVQGGGALMRAEASGPATWSPPSTAVHPANCIMLLPDAMYIFAPLSLSMLAKDDHQGARFEFGGLAARPPTPAAPPQDSSGLFGNPLPAKPKAGAGSNGGAPLVPAKAGEAGKKAEAGGSSSGSKGPGSSAWTFQRAIVDFDLRSGLLAHMVRERY